MPLTLADLTGYVERDLDADLDRWFSDEDPVEVSDDIRPIDYMLAKLPADGAAALAAFDRRVRSGDMPYFLDVDEYSYGFDFAANDCGIRDSDYETELTDDDLFTVGMDGGGNYYAVLANGQVAVWFHEEEVLEGDTRFDNLDVFLWSIVRYEAVRAGVLDREEVEADFIALGQAGVLHPELGLLKSMRPLPRSEDDDFGDDDEEGDDTEEGGEE